MLSARSFTKLEEVVQMPGSLADMDGPVWKQSDRNQGDNDFDRYMFLMLRSLLTALGFLVAAIMTVFARVLVEIFGIWGCVGMVVLSMAAGAAGVWMVSKDDVMMSAIAFIIFLVASGNMFAAPLELLTPLRPPLILVLSMFTLAWQVFDGTHEIKHRDMPEDSQQAKEDRVTDMMRIMTSLISLAFGFYWGGWVFFTELLITAALAYWISYCMEVSKDMDRNVHNAIDSSAWIFGYPFYLMLRPVQLLLRRGS